MAPPAKKPTQPPAVKKAEADARAKKKKENEELIKELTPDQIKEFREAFKVERRTRWSKDRPLHAIWSNSV